MKTMQCMLAAAILASGSAFAKQNVDYDYARVISADPIVKIVRVTTPRQECWEEQVTYRDSRPRSATPTLVGSIIGGVIGNEVGRSKDAKRAGVVVGALLGGSIARDITRDRYANNYRVGTEEVCKTYEDVHEEERIMGYDVIYKYRGQTYNTETSEHPGDRIKVRVSVSPVASYQSSYDRSGYTHSGYGQPRYKHPKYSHANYKGKRYGF